MIAKTVSGVFDEIIKIPSRVSFPSLPGKKDVNKELEKEDSDQINIEFDIDSKYVCEHFLYRSYFSLDGKNGTHSDSSKSNGMDKEFENNYLIICRYLKPCKKSKDNFIAYRKFTCYQIKILYILWEKYMLLIFSLNLK